MRDPDHLRGDRSAIEQLVALQRREQGLPERISDPAALRALAELLRPAQDRHAADQEAA